LFAFAIINTYLLEKNIESAFNIFVLFNEIALYLYAILKLVFHLINIKFSITMLIQMMGAIVLGTKTGDIIFSNFIKSKNE
jgi:hypothetical protein